MNYKKPEMLLYKNTDKQVGELSDPADRQMSYYERYGNGGTKTYSSMAGRIDVEPCYQPENPNSKTYIVPRVLVDNREGLISVYREISASKATLGLVLRGDAVWMYVFPQFFKTNLEDQYLRLLKQKQQAKEDIQVIPTSSCRTVLDFNSKVMIKMHCPYLISRFDRRLGKGTVEHSIAVSRELKDLLGSGRYPKFAILPDSVGVTFNGEKGWGYIVREIIPFPLVAEALERTMIPMFALYGSDILDPFAPILIIQMIDRAYKESGTTFGKAEFAKKFVLEELIFPLIDFFIVVYKEKGILLELHGQNTLIEIDERGLPTRIVYRDLDTAIDLDVRKEKGLGVAHFYEGQFISRSDGNKEPGSEQSVIFDKSIGRMNLDKLAESVEMHYGIPSQELELATQAHFSEQFPEFRKYFPEDLRCVYNYSSKMKPGQYNYYDIIPIPDDTARWRPEK